MQGYLVLWYSALPPTSQDLVRLPRSEAQHKSHEIAQHDGLSRALPCANAQANRHARPNTPALSHHPHP